MCPAIEPWDEKDFVARPSCRGLQVLETSPYRGDAAEIMNKR
jgi:hypothetical protein